MLGPTIAKEDLGGAGDVGDRSLAAGGVGAVIGGRDRISLSGPNDPLFVSTVAAIPMALQLVLLSRSRARVAAFFVSLVGQIGLAVGITLWFTVFQQNISQRAQSRVSSYDTLWSFILIPLGLAAIGPLANEFGQEQTLLIAAVSYVILMGTTAALPSVRAIRQQRPPGDVSRG